MCVWPRAILQYLLGGMVHQFSFLTAFMLSIIISGGVALKCLNGSPMHQYYTTICLASAPLSLALPSLEHWTAHERA